MCKVLCQLYPSTDRIKPTGVEGPLQHSEICYLNTYEQIHSELLFPTQELLKSLQKIPGFLECVELFPGTAVIQNL